MLEAAAATALKFKSKVSFGCGRNPQLSSGGSNLYQESATHGKIGLVSLQRRALITSNCQAARGVTVACTSTRRLGHPARSLRITVDTRNTFFLGPKKVRSHPLDINVLKMFVSVAYITRKPLQRTNTSSVSWDLKWAMPVTVLVLRPGVRG